MSRGVSHIGDGIALIALVLYVKGTEHSGLAVGALLLAQSLPHVLGPLAGTLVDRIRLKRLMVGCELGQVVIFAVIAWWQPPFTGLLPLVVLAAALDTTFGPASNSAVPALVNPSNRMQANAWLGTSFNLQVAVGPFLGGFLVSTLGVRWALLANALSFALSAIFLSGLPGNLRVPATITPGVLAGGLEGLRYVWCHPAIRAIVVGVFFVVAFVAVDNVALVFLTRDVLKTTPLGFGAVAATFGVGMLAGSIVLSLLRSAPRAAPLWTIGLFLSGVGTLVTGLAPNVAAAAGAQALGGLGNGIDNVASATLIQELVPSEMHGRVFGLFGSAAFVGSSLAYVLAGVLLDVTSPRITFIVGGLGALAVIALVAPSLVRAGRRAE